MFKEGNAVSVGGEVERGTEYKKNGYRADCYGKRFYIPTCGELACPELACCELVEPVEVVESIRDYSPTSFSSLKK